MIFTCKKNSKKASNFTSKYLAGYVFCVNTHIGNINLPLSFFLKQEQGIFMLVVSRFLPFRKVVYGVASRFLPSRRVVCGVASRFLPYCRVVYGVASRFLPPCKVVHGLASRFLPSRKVVYGAASRFLPPCKVVHGVASRFLLLAHGCGMPPIILHPNITK
jgi:hypothetical protein